MSKPLFDAKAIAALAVRDLALGEADSQLVEAATALANEAQANCGKDKHQLVKSIHVVGPGETDSTWTVSDKDGNTFDNATGLRAGPNEALVVARTQRKSDGEDYAWYHEEAGVGPSYYMRRAANSVRGSFPGLDISEPAPI